jgi:PTS system nitrogen regulatory IIA component
MKFVEDLHSANKKGVLEELSNVLVQGGKLPDQDEVVEVLLEREKLGSTGIGDGVAIPHGKMKGIKELIASFGRSIKGINFESVDNKPTHLFFKDPSFRNRLMEARDQQDLFHIIVEEDEKF